MTIYRANPKDGLAWITGGSTGMGRQLSLDLAREGWTVAVTARDEDPIDSLIEETSGLRGKVLSFPCDVTNEKRMAGTVDRIESEAGPIALAVFNAGNYLPVYGEDLDLDKFRKTYDLNVFGILHGLIPLVGRMQSRGRGHVVMIGSVTSYFGWPTAAAYGASKAAVNSMAEALRYDFEKMNIRIQVMNPGFVDTPLTAKNEFDMPAMMPVDKAVARMMKGIKSGAFEVTFPRRFTWGLKFLRLMPQFIRFRFINYATGWRGRPIQPKPPESRRIA